MAHQLFKMVDLCGAVTHVLVQDPTQGYAVFADMMVKQMRETGN